MKPGAKILWLLLPMLLLMGVFVIGLAYLSVQSLLVDDGIGLGNYIAFFQRPDYVRVLLRTLEIAFLTTIVTLVIGYPTAYVIARARMHRDLLLLLVILPWLVSIVVRTYGWIVLLGTRGAMNSFLSLIGLIDSPFRVLFTQTGVVIGLVHVFLPFMVIAILTVMMHIDKSMEEATKMLGAGPMQTLFRVTGPLSLPGVTSGCTIVFLLSSGAIITPLLLGGPRNSMLATQIYQDVFQIFDFPKAATMAFLLTACAAVIILPLQVVERRLLRNMKGSDN
jgi:putative spermidine/putrescine transport system permease protein